MVFLLELDNAPDSAPKMLRFRPAAALAWAWCSCVSTSRAPCEAGWCCAWADGVVSEFGIFAVACAERVRGWVCGAWVCGIWALVLERALW